jgi:3-oxoacyl-(acyl-carrier-protein) synthase
LIAHAEVQPRAVTGWPTSGSRQAFLVPPFRPADVVPGLKTRRLDRLSVWSLVASALAIQDAGIDLDAEDRSRVAVVFGTGFGCIELTETYFKSIADNGYGRSDPILFPETLSNAPASHVARVFGLRGPNITVMCKGVSGEAALLRAASLLRSGEADVALVLAGDTLTRTLFEWYEAASALSGACFGRKAGCVPFSPDADGFVPGEGLAAVVMEPEDRRGKRGVRPYARLRSGHLSADPKATDTSWGSSPEPTVALIRKVLGDLSPSDIRLLVSSANGSPSLDHLEATAIRQLFGACKEVRIAVPKTVCGEFDGGGILRLVVALSEPGSGTSGEAILLPREQRREQTSVAASLGESLTLLIGASAGGARAGLLLDRLLGDRPASTSVERSQVARMNVRIASTAYAVPPTIETVDAIMEREKNRVEAALQPLSDSLTKRVLDGLGLKQVRVCDAEQPYDLAREAAVSALAEAGIDARQVDLIIDFSTLPGENREYLSFAHKLSAELGTEASLNLSYKVGGCGALHLAIKNALALMAADENLRVALLVTADSPPAGSRSLLPITVQGDAGSAVVLTRSGADGPLLLGLEVLTLGHLHDTIAVSRSVNGHRDLVINVDSARIENELMPIYYLNFFRLVHKMLGKLSLKLNDIDHIVYSNISRADQEGFLKALGLSPRKLCSGKLEAYGHTFASDLVINYTDLRHDGRIQPGQLLLFASAGIGFTWGVTLARA